MKWLLVLAMVGCIHSVPPRSARATLTNGIRYMVEQADDRKISLGVLAGSLHEEDGATGASWLLPIAMAKAIGVPLPRIIDRADYTAIEQDGLELQSALYNLRSFIDVPLDNVNFDPPYPPYAGSHFYLPSELVPWLGTRLARHPEWGVRDAAIRVTDLERYRARWYVAPRMVIFVRGPWPVADVVREIERVFGDLPPKSAPPEPPLVAPGAPVELGADRPTRDRMLAFRMAAPVPNTKAELRASIARWLFVQALSARLIRMVTPPGASSLDTVDDWPTIRLERLTRDVVSLQISQFSTLNELVKAVETVRASPFSREDLDEARKIDLTTSSGPKIDSPSLGGELCDDPAARFALGFLFVDCESEDNEWRRILPTITDGELDALRALLDVHVATRLR